MSDRLFRRGSFLARFSARVIAASLVLTAPGLDVYRAAAQAISAVPAEASAPRVAPTGAGLQDFAGAENSPFPLSGAALPGGFAFVAAPAAGAASAAVSPARAASAVIPATPVSGRAAARIVSSAHARLKILAGEPSAALGGLGAAAAGVKAQVEAKDLASAKAEAGKAFEGLPGAARGEAQAAAGNGLRPNLVSRFTGRSLPRQARQDFPPVVSRAASRPAPMGGYFGMALGLSAVSASQVILPLGGWLLPAALAIFLWAYLLAQREKQVPGAAAQSLAPPRAGASSETKGWLAKFGVLAGLFLALDWAVKSFFLRAGLPFVYHELGSARQMIMQWAIPLNIVAAAYFLSLAHSREAPLKWLRRLKARRPILGSAIYGFLYILTFPMGLGEQRYAGNLPQKYPALKKVLGFIDGASAALLAAALGNGLEGLVNGKVIDFIPFGHARANLADMMIFFGMPLLWMALDFLGAARKADANRQPIAFKSWKFYLLPILGLTGFVLATSQGYQNVPAPAWYALLFSSLFSIGIITADFIMHRFVETFNRGFRPVGVPAAWAEPAGASMSFGYRFKKRAAAILAALGFAVGAPRLGAGDWQALSERYRRFPPKLVILDWDDTFRDSNGGKGLAVAPEQLALLRALKAKGVRVAVATNRPLNGGDFSMSHLLMDRLPQDLREGFIISAGGGAAYRYGKAGEKPVTSSYAVLPLTAGEIAAIRAALAKAAVKSGVGKGGFNEERKSHEMSFVMEKSREKAKKLFAEFQKALWAAGLEYHLTLKFPADPANAPYIRLAKADKSDAVKGILALLEAEGTRLEPEEMLVFGDDFTNPGYDSAMAQELPGAVVLAVGRGADPRLDNVYLAPKIGPASTAAFLNGILKAAP